MFLISFVVGANQFLSRNADHAIMRVFCSPSKWSGLCSVSELPPVSSEIAPEAVSPTLDALCASHFGIGNMAQRRVVPESAVPGPYLLLLEGTEPSHILHPACLQCWGSNLGPGTQSTTE